MDQRIYYGNINPEALADYLVGVFHQSSFHYQHQHTMAQKIRQGERIFVQIMRQGDWSGGHKAIGIHILKIVGGVSVEMGASDWMDLDETGLAGMLLGALFFPPLLLFPLIQGLTNSSFSYDVWNVIDTYCTQVSGGGQSHKSRAPQGFYCTYCGAFNHPGSPGCHSCQAPFHFAPAQPPAEAAAAPASPPPAAPVQEPQPEANVSQAKGDTKPMFALMICPSCKATVVPAHFCGNCAAPLPDVDE